MDKNTEELPPTTTPKKTDYRTPTDPASKEFYNDYSYKLFDYHKIFVDAGQSPIRIDKFLMDRVERTTRSRIQNAIKLGIVKVNDSIIKANYKVKPDDLITLFVPRTPDSVELVEPEDLPLDIRYEDEELLVIYKPAGMVVHPGLGHRGGTLVNALAYHFRHTKLPVKDGNMSDRPGLVHRIDKNTSGLLVVAKTEFAMSHLAKQFFEHTTYRRYQALVWGVPEQAEGTIVGHIGRDHNDRKLFRVFEEGEDGKHAITHYRVIEDLYYISLVECQLETGRTHQIRVHMKHIGHPLFNDDRYGGNRILKGTVYSKYKSFVDNAFGTLPRQALHAKSLGFVHPTTGEWMQFDTELPEDFTTCLDKWRRYLASRKPGDIEANDSPSSNEG
jgi:23S rRNA pseudouridine1911/1915/1917 synthase